eukprot:770108_1
MVINSGTTSSIVIISSLPMLSWTFDLCSEPTKPATTIGIMNFLLKRILRVAFIVTSHLLFSYAIFLFGLFSFIQAHRTSTIGIAKVIFNDIIIFELKCTRVAVIVTGHL